MKTPLVRAVAVLSVFLTLPPVSWAEDPQPNPSPTLNGLGSMDPNDGWRFDAEHNMYVKDGSPPKPAGTKDAVVAPDKKAKLDETPAKTTTKVQKAPTVTAEKVKVADKKEPGLKTKSVPGEDPHVVKPESSPGLLHDITHSPLLWGFGGMGLGALIGGLIGGPLGVLLGGAMGCIIGLVAQGKIQG